MPSNIDAAVIDGCTYSDTQARQLIYRPLDERLLNEAAECRDLGFGKTFTFSKKVFIPLTELCRDVCHYCTFSKPPSRLSAAYMSVDEVLALARRGAAMGCKEALFTLGEKPELRYRAAREALSDLGFDSTVDYVLFVAQQVLHETGLIPHINAGNLTRAEIEQLRAVSGSMGLMLESASERLCEKGMPHYGSPDKAPAKRLETIALAGECRVPFTSGILIGIGETRLERIDSLLALRAVHRRYGHLQEIIVQNFRAKPNTRMETAPEPDLDELLWTIAVARLIFGPNMSIQAPPNLSPGVLPLLINAGINDWGGVSPLTPDHVNPEAPWPQLEELARQTAIAGMYLDERLTVYPTFVRNADTWIDSAVRQSVARMCDGEGFARSDNWTTGGNLQPQMRSIAADADRCSPAIKHTIDTLLAGDTPAQSALAGLFTARGTDFHAVCGAADNLRRERCGDTVSYVINRNINYTNICGFRCGFCAFSKGKTHVELRGQPYRLPVEEIAQRVQEAQLRGATEVCLQGGIHPEFDGNTYLDIVRTVRDCDPNIHIHAFSPLEVLHGATTLGVTVKQFLHQLRDAGLNTLPGTAAEILDDEVRAIICPDKLNTETWVDVVCTAHSLGLKTTATIMFGHVDNYQSWAKHLLTIRAIQRDTQGFTEFVPLPFVANEAPMFRKLPCRHGPTFRETILMHAVARLVFNGLIDNIQASWVKLGEHGIKACLASGVNDLGGTLMDESITRAAGATNGQEFSPERMQMLIASCDRLPRQRTTLYGPVVNTIVHKTSGLIASGN